MMMRGPKDVAVAVRKADGTIDVDVKPVNSISDRYPILKKPLLRGVVALVESLVMGMKALSYSAQVSGDEDEQMDDKEIRGPGCRSFYCHSHLVHALSAAVDPKQPDPESGGRLFTHGHFSCLYCRHIFYGRYPAGVQVPRGGAQDDFHLRSGHAPDGGKRADLSPAAPPLRHQLPDDRHADQHLYFCLSGLAQPGGTDPVPDRVNAGGGGHQLRADPLCRKE